jgi:dTDP-4-amino-4,6-dideoxygalactose transaminase/glycosyltransferase involved in cell wall biosynthesis/SAM-dependent methyltransferase
MRIGYVLAAFSPLSEAFIRREVLALCGEGHRVFVYTNCKYDDPRVEEPSDPNLVIREIPFVREAALLAQAAFDDGIEHLHGSLMSAAHRAAFIAAEQLQTPFTLMAYSGHDIFTRREPDLYQAASNSPLCVSIIVEDAFMRDWMTEQLGVASDKMSLIPNSFDLDLYRLRESRSRHERPVILSIARFVEKKGLIFLVEAFNQLCAARVDAELRLVGYGPEESGLRQAAGGNTRVRFLGSMSEAETRRAYAEADIFCLPCIRTATGDADGIPTTVLEAMAFKLPVVSTNLLSTPCYIRDGRDGLLVEPRDPASLSNALKRLCTDAGLREEMGRRGRARVSEICDLKRNIKRLADIFIEGRSVSWREKLTALEGQRQSYTPAREAYYTECRVRAADYFQPRAGKLLEIGCGLGKFRSHLPPAVEYYGCDTLPYEEARGAFPFVTARAESLPFRDNSFDGVLFYAVLIHVLDVDRALAEAARVLKPGGQLYLQECYDDPNPIHINHFSGASLRRRLAEYFNVLRSHPANEYLMMMVAEKPLAVREAVNSSTVEPREPPPLEEEAEPALEERAFHQPSQLPLVSICIATYNRAELVRISIDSVLRQTYGNIEVVVVDDGSSDDTRRVLESYGSAIRVAYNERNHGIAFSKNRVLMLSSNAASYVGILDSDDYYHPQFVERCVEYLESHPSIGLVYTDDIMVDVNGSELRRQPAVEPWDMDKWLRTRNLRGDTWLARRALVMKTNLHDEVTELDDDYDLFYQLLEITTFAHLPEFLVFIRQHDGRTTAANHLALTRAHAANLVKYGYSPEYAYLRARGHPEWIPAIEEGVRLGRQIYEQRRRTPLQSEVVKHSNSNGHVRLAIAGGEPVRSSFLPFGAPCLGEEEINEVVDTLRSGWIGTGPKALRFEQEFADYVGVNHAISLNSCTAGLFLSLAALGLGADDEVITTTLTFGATVNVIEHVGARPVLVDIDPVTLNINPELVERAVTRRTKVIIPVHFGGLSSDMDALQRIADHHQLVILEDAAHAVGTRFKDRMAGSLGRLASFSFYANKNLTTAEGGMVTTDDEALAETIRRLRLHGLSSDAWKRFDARRLLRPDIEQPGYKFNMPDLAAAIGLQQLRKQERFLQTRERYARIYDEAFAGLPVRFQPRPQPPESSRHSLHLYVLMLDDGGWRVHRDEVVKALLAENVGAVVHYPAIHTHSFYRKKYGYQPQDFPHALATAERILSLPLTPAMSEADVSDVVRAVRKVAAAYAE